MTAQDKKTPKVGFLCRLTYENYDFLYSRSERGDKSIARVLNEVIEHTRKSDITSCSPTTERILVR